MPTKKILELAKKWDSKKSLDGKMSYLKGNVKKQGNSQKIISSNIRMELNKR